VARLIQGGFGALLIPQGLAIMTAVFPRDFKSVAFASFGPMMALASIGGPILGAYIVNANWLGLSWRPMFLINIVFGGLGLVLAAKVLPRIPADLGVILDAPGSVLLSVAVLGLIAGLIDGPEFGWGLWPVSLLTIGVATFIAFCFRQATVRNPLIRPSLLRNRGFTTGMVAGLGYFAVVSGLAYVVSLFCQQALHRDPVQTALTGIVPMSVGIIIASVIAAPLIGRFGRKLVATGVATTGLGAGWLWLTVHNAGLAQGTWSLVGPMVVTGLGMGLTFGTLFDIALGDASPEEAGSAGGGMSAVQQLAGAIGSAVITSIWLAYGADMAQAMQVCLIVSGLACVAILALVPLLPRTTTNAGLHG
jgi:MFS family permease